MQFSIISPFAHDWKEAQPIIILFGWWWWQDYKVKILKKKKKKKKESPWYIKPKDSKWFEHRWFVYRAWFELVFESLGNSFNGFWKQMFRDTVVECSYFIMEIYVVYTNKNRHIDAVLMNTLNIQLFL